MPVNSCRTALLDRGSVSPCRAADHVNICRVGKADVNLCRTHDAATAALNDSDAAALDSLR
jgi:hypothetical protein